MLDLHYCFLAPRKQLKNYLETRNIAILLFNLSKLMFLFYKDWNNDAIVEPNSVLTAIVNK